MLDSGVYRVLDHPAIYRCAQLLLSPGQRRILQRLIGQIITKVRPPRLALDIGCGPNSWLWQFDIYPIGVDITPSYASEYAHNDSRIVIASSSALPFVEGTFDQAWCFGLLHHLPDEFVEQTLCEMRRVTSPDGALIIIDAVMPDRSLWRNPLPWIIRKLDRGSYVRSEAEHRRLLGSNWVMHRYFSSYIGLEVMVAVTSSQSTGR